MMVITAGHVDHGKSTLIKLLTGTDPDRLAEEQARGLTIELGFAFATLPSGASVAFVDVPGHDRFIRTMLSGCGSVDAALLVVSAVEGWKPQTEEHVQILDLLGMRSGVIALTHTDLLGDASIDPMVAEVRQRVTGTFLEGCEIVPTAASEPSTIDELRAALDALVGSDASRWSSTSISRPRLWIDRSFTLSGHGRVVTGSLTGGSIAEGDQLQIVHGDSVDQVRIRSVHANGVPASAAEPGHRVALNVAGRAGATGRGGAVVRSEQWGGGEHVHASLTLVRSLVATPRERGSYRLFVGTTSVPVRIRYLDPEPGGEHEPRLVRFRAAAPIAPISMGDRFVLRDESVQRTVGGGIVLAVDPSPALHDLASLRARYRAGELHDLRDRTESLGRVVIAEHHGTMPTAALIQAVGPMNIEGLMRRGATTVTDDGSADSPADRPSSVDRSAVRQAQMIELTKELQALFDEQRPPLLTPEDLAVRSGLATSVRAELQRFGYLRTVGPFLTTVDSFATMSDVIGDALRGLGTATIAELRDATGYSRKFLVPLLESLDRTGLTLRSGDRRSLAARLT